MPMVTAGTAAPAASTVASFRVSTQLEKSTPPIRSPMGGMMMDPKLMQEHMKMMQEHMGMMQNMMKMHPAAKPAMPN